MSRYTGGGRFGTTSVLALPVLLLDFCAWVVLLAGVSALQQQCGSSGEAVNGAAVGGSLLPASVCRNVYRFQWWVTMLQLVTLLAALVSVALSWVAHHRVAICSMLGIVTVLLILETNTFLSVHDAINHGSVWKRANTYFSGALMCSFFNFLLIIFLGHSGESYRRGAAGTTGTTGVAPAGTTGPTGGMGHKAPGGTTAATEPVATV